MGEHRLNRIVTRTGDDGSTGLADGSRLSKASLRVTALGDIDELNAGLGLLKVRLSPEDGYAVEWVQQRLFDMGGELSLPGHMLLNEDRVAQLEGWCRERNAALPPLREFVVPGVNELSARAHLARTVCRRAERSLVQLMAQESVSTVLLAFLNRLSDFLFILARELCDQDKEVMWQKGEG